MNDFETAVRELVRQIVREELAQLSPADPTVDGGSPWYSIADAAVYRGVSERTLHRMIREGRLRSTTVGRRRLLHRDDLDGLATAGEDVTPITPPRRRGA